MFRRYHGIYGTKLDKLLCFSVLVSCGPPEEGDLSDPNSLSPFAESEEKKSQAFLRAVASYSPRLRYVAVGVLEDDMSYRWEDDYSGTEARWRWWKVVRDGWGRPTSIVEIPTWEGELVRTFLRESSRGKVENFDGECRNITSCGDNVFLLA